MIVELVNTGSELMCGRALNTHQQWLCRQLADAGYVVRRQVAVSDEPADIAAAVRESLGQADLVITTGGLGPTSDDRTREVIADLLGLKLRENREVLDQVRNYFEKRNRPMPERVRVEALVPEGAIILPNRHGTAPGLAVPVPPGRFRPGSSPAWLLMLPGPPRELQPMFLESALPLLRRELRPAVERVCRTVHTCGLGESLVQERVEPALSEFVRSGVKIGYCARPGQVDVRLTFAGPGSGDVIARAEQALRAALGGHVFGVDDQSLESVLIDLLAAKGRTLAVAESCTGGCLAH
ncbi:MAG TPA: molybdopterin-binding protein, partial [Verrucomicrobiota bacterium]|nr:molybdopterin-binding protein [Verrucomicrobiota bacterium]